MKIIKIKPILIFLFLLLSACKSDQQPKYQVGGTIVKIDESHYSIVIVRNDSSTPVAVDAVLTDSFKNPSKFRVPMSIQAMWVFSTDKCGYITFYQALTGDILCPECNLARRSCPLPLGAVEPLNWHYVEF